MNVRLKSLEWLIALVVISASFDCYGQGRSASSCDLLKLDSLIGTVSLSLGSDIIVGKTMPCLLSLWRENKNRGSGGFYISNAFLSVMEENPPAFFSIMLKEPETFSEWMGGLQDLSFTWSGPPPCGLEAKRKQLISILQHSQIGDSKAAALKDAVIIKLSSIHCRQID